MAFVLAAICAVLTFLTVLFGVVFLRRSLSVDIFHRLRRHYHVDKTGSGGRTLELLRRAYQFIQRTAKPIADLNLVKRLDFKVKQAGLPVFGSEFIIISVIVALIVAVSIYIITLNIVAFPLTLMGVLLGIWFWLKIMIRRRREAFTEQLGDCLTTVANALRAGYSFQQAMDVVSKEMEPPISSEFERVSTDVAMGVPLETALEQMNHRVGSSDFDLVVTAVLIQREIGGNLAQILDTISYTINERIRMRREIKTLTAQGRFSAWILLLLPFATAAFCWMFNNDQMQLFITEESGRIAIAVSIIMEIIGFIVIQRIVDIEV